MKKSFIYLSSAFLAASLFSSCSEDKSENLIQDESSYVNLSFSLSTSDMKTRTVVDSSDDDSDATGLCWTDDINDFDFDKILNNEDGYTYEARIKMYYNVEKSQTDYSSYTSDEFYVPIKMLNIDDDGPKAVTDEFSLIKPADGYKHVVDRILIVQKNGSTENVAFSTVKEGSNYATHVREDHWMPIDMYVGKDTEEKGIKLNDLAKEPIEISLLCAAEDKAPNFGYAIWTPNFVRVVCIPYSVNVKNDPCNSASQDIYGITSIKIFREFEDTSIQDEENLNKYTLSHEGSTTASNRIGKICFSDQGTTPNDEEVYTLQLTIDFESGKQAIIEGQIPLESLWNYKKSGYWEIPKGSTTTDGYIHFNFFNQDLTQVGPLEPLFTYDNVGDSEEEAAEANKYLWNLSVVTAVDCESDEICTGIDAPTSFPNIFVNQPEKKECRWDASCLTQSCFCETGEVIMHFCGFLKSPAYSLTENKCFAISTSGKIDANKKLYGVKLINLTTGEECNDFDVEFKDVNRGIAKSAIFYSKKVETDGNYRLLFKSSSLRSFKINSIDITTKK